MFTGKIKKSPQTVGPDPKNGGRSEETFFIHHIKEGIEVVKAGLHHLCDREF